MRESRIFWNTFQKDARWLVTLAVAACLGGSVAWTLAQEREQERPMGQAIFVGDTVLEPYDPVPALVTRTTRVDRARFPATDIHAHWPATLESAALLTAMDELGVERAVNLSGAPARNSIAC